MLRDATGRYAASLAGGETVRAFVPDPLPPVPPLDLNGARQAALERATLALGRLDSIALLLPDPQLFLYAYVRREAVLSSQIEGTQSSLSDLLLFELDEVPGVPFDDVVEVSNYVAALEHGMARLREGFPLCNRLLREMHAHLMARGRGSDKAPGEFRRSQNWIGGTRPGNARFVPPPPQEVEPCMAALEGFIHDETGRAAGAAQGGAGPCPVRDHPPLPGRQWPPRAPAHRPAAAPRRRAGPAAALPQPLLQATPRPSITTCWTGCAPAATGRPGSISFSKASSRPPHGAVQTARRLVDLFQQDSQRTQACGRGAANALRVLDALRQRPCPACASLANTPA